MNSLNLIAAGISYLVFVNGDKMNFFLKWIETHRVNVKDNSHFRQMYENWLSNDLFIDANNRLNKTYTLGHNAFSGMSYDEYVEYNNLYDNKKENQPSLIELKATSVDASELPISWDWRTKGVVANVRDQGQCGSCWAFSGVSTLESATAIKTGTLSDLSEQQGVDCSTVKEGWQNMGCNGGWYYNLWSYVSENNGLTSETCYPYTSGTTTKTGVCQKSCKPVPNTKVLGQVSIKPKSDTAMLNGLYVNPVSVAIEADARSFQLYKSGVYTDQQCGSSLNHAVVLTGWGTDESGKDYYVLRNSWGTGWGDGGYMKIGRGSQYGATGLCGVLSDGYYPVV